MVQYVLNLYERGSQIDAGDIGKLLKQVALESRHIRCFKSGHVTQGHIGQIVYRIDHKEVGSHRAPIDFAKRSNAPFRNHAAHIKSQTIAHFQAECFGNADFNTHRIALAFFPLALNHGIVFGLDRARRQVKFAVDHSFGPVIGVICRADLFAVDGYQTAANHRVPIVACHIGLLQRSLKRLSLIGLDVDDKSIWRIHGSGLAPAVDEIGAQQNQQDQGQQSNRQCADLNHCINGARHDLARGQQKPSRRGV